MDYFPASSALFLLTECQMLKIIACFSSKELFQVVSRTLNTFLLRFFAKILKMFTFLLNHWHVRGPIFFSV